MSHRHVIVKMDMISYLPLIQAKAFPVILLFWKVKLSFIPWRRYLSFILMYFHNLYYALSINFTKKKQRLFTRKAWVITSFNNEQVRFKRYRRGRISPTLPGLMGPFKKKILKYCKYLCMHMVPSWSLILNTKASSVNGIQNLVIHSL